MSLFCRLPIELIVAIATLLDAHALAYFKSTCKAFRDIVNQTPSLQYVFALATRGLRDGPPSSVTPTSRLELVEAYDGAWRTLSWSKHLMLPEFNPHGEPYISGGTLVLPTLRPGGYVRSFVVYSIPSPLRGIPGRRWQIDFDFDIMWFIVDASQDLLALVPLTHDMRSILMRTLSTGQPHSLAANLGVLHMEASRRPSQGDSKRGICGDFFGTIVARTNNPFDEYLLIWNWKTGVLHVNMHIILGADDEAVFSFLDDCHFVLPSYLSDCPSDIDLDIYRLYSYPDPKHEGQQQAVPSVIVVRSYVLTISNIVENVRTLRFFEDVSARGGAPFPPGNFYADPSKRQFCIQFWARSLDNKAHRLQELVVPIQALHSPTRELPYQLANVLYEPCFGRSVVHAFKAAAAMGCTSIAPKKLPPALRTVDAGWLRYAVCYGALLVFEYTGETPLSRRLHILTF